MSQSAQPSQPSFYAIIPATVRYCREVEQGAKLLYGELTALASQQGYCWASNKYLSDLYGVDQNTIKRWIRSLKSQKFISVDVEKTGFQSTRKIWISPELKKISTKDQKCPTGGAISDPRGDEIAPCINTSINTEEEREREGGKPPTPSLFQYQGIGSGKKRVSLDMSKYTSLCSDFGKEKITHMCERLDEYADINPKRFHQYACHAAVIRKWIRDDSTKTPGKPSEMPKESLSSHQSTSNLKIAKDLAKQAPELFESGGITICPDYVQIKITRGYSTAYDLLAYNENGFEEQLKSAIRKLGGIISK